VFGPCPPQQNQAATAAQASSAAPATETSAAATRILTLKEAVTVDELANDEEYNDILEDMREECGKVRCAGMGVPVTSSVCRVLTGVGVFVLAGEGARSLACPQSRVCPSAVCSAWRVIAQTSRDYRHSEALSCLSTVCIGVSFFLEERAEVLVHQLTRHGYHPTPHAIADTVQALTALKHEQAGPLCVASVFARWLLFYVVVAFGFKGAYVLRLLVVSNGARCFLLPSQVLLVNDFLCKI
jgi:hypothetical protein